MKTSNKHLNLNVFNSLCKEYNLSIKLETDCVIHAIIPSKYVMGSFILEYNKIPTAINADSKINDSFILPIISNLINLVVSEYKRNYDEKYYHSFYFALQSSHL